MDDVLVQVLFRRPRTQVLDLIKKARLLFASQQEELQEYREQLRVGGEEGIKTPNGATVPSESDAHTLAADSTNTPSRSFSFRLFSGKKTDVPTANITPSRPSTSRSISRDGAGTLSLLEQRTCTDVLTELVETEVLQALSDTKGVENTKFPIAKAVGKAFTKMKHFFARILFLFCRC